MVAEKRKMKQKIVYIYVYIFFAGKMRQCFIFIPFLVCLDLTQSSSGPSGVAGRGWGQDSTPFTHLKQNVSQFLPGSIYCCDVRGRTKVDLISGLACRQLGATSGKLLPNFPTFCDEEYFHFFLHSRTFVKFHFNTLFWGITLLEGIHPSL